jgi:hypothetical protein
MQSGKALERRTAFDVLMAPLALEKRHTPSTVAGAAREEE